MSVEQKSVRKTRNNKYVLVLSSKSSDRNDLSYGQHFLMVLNLLEQDKSSVGLNLLLNLVAHPLHLNCFDQSV